MSTDTEKPWLRLYDAVRTSTAQEPPDALRMFTSTLERDPDAIAVRYFDAPLPFGEVDRLASALAVELHAAGIGHHDRVVVYAQNVPQFLVAVVAAWKVGAIAVSANPMLKDRELRHLVEDCGARAIVTLDGLWHDVARAATAGTTIELAVTTSELDLLDGATPPSLAEVRRRPAPDALDLLAIADRRAGESLPQPSITPDDVALIVYTSGTTGPSKGAMITHANLVFNARTFRDWTGLTAADPILGIAPLFHVTGLVGQLALSMLTGAPLLLASRFDVQTTLDLVERHHPAFVVGSITVFIALMEAPGFANRDLSSLRMVFSGGAPVPPAVAARFESQVGTPIRGIYGLTETTSPSHMVPLEHTAPTDPGSGTLAVGVPVYETTVRIVDDVGLDLPIGQPGELVVSGPQVVAGYWERPDENDAAFLDGGLRTGDIGFMDADGWFFLVDRKKDQINASGYKVWPRDVEDVLYEHPAVREAAVVGVADPYRGESVKAFVSLRPGREASEAELIAFCRDRLAAYKYPRAVEVVAELPKTATGKILRRALRDGPAMPTTPRPGGSR